MSDFSYKSEWKTVRKFSELRQGMRLRLKDYPSVECVFKWEGHGLAVVFVPTLGRDALCKLKELEREVDE